MAHAKFPAEVLTPEGEVFNEEIEMVSTRTTVGSIGILAGHQPTLAMLEPTELRLYRSDDEIVRFAQAEGYLQITGGRALILVEAAWRPDELDAINIPERLRAAKETEAAAKPGSEAARLARLDVRRWEAFSRMLEQGG